MGKVKLVLVLLVLMIFLLLLVQNLDPVPFKFQPFGQIDVPKTVLILLSAALGSVATLLAQWYVKRARRRSQTTPLQSS